MINLKKTGHVTLNDEMQAGKMPVDCCFVNNIRIFCGVCKLSLKWRTYSKQGTEK